MKLHVHFIPYEEITAPVAVVIDVLRATSSIAVALASGVEKIYIAGDLSEAAVFKKLHPKAYLAGERNSVKIKGFDFGNSPLEFLKLKKGSELILTTSNGTTAIKKSMQSERLFTASFLNAGIVVNKILELGEDTQLICAGSDGHPSLEDTLCAGYIVNEVSHVSELTDAAKIALNLYLRNSERIEQVLSQVSSHGTRLVSIGFEKDVAFCAKINVFNVLPTLVDGALTKGE
ncbi:2-phosphosulfolactate phosphatase [Kosmotoga sp. DU53]|uniref:2-phosphosulfolactate phosphatase n=1 Tax=Kosmotoga sp. DU53 TaxID=1310160 RepID=UPI0007C59C79|nr:2-phosphosulfolactate phosphatase [Kosmotoga sp. DU53]